jgi:hypothetical protein
MTAGLATMLINAVIIVLLAITIGYCWLLNRRIKVLQDSRGELAQLLKHFDDSTQRASESIIALQTASRKIGDNIQHRIDKANYLMDDLAFMVEKGNKLANQMEAGFAVGRAQQRVTSEQPRTAVRQPPANPVMMRDEAVEAPRPVVRAPVEEPQPAEPARFAKYELPTEAAQAKTAVAEAASARAHNTLEEALSRVVNRSREVQPQEDAARQQPRERQAAGRVRSRSEQELLDLIKAGIKG